MSVYPCDDSFRNQSEMNYFSGDENYDNHLKYGKEVFEELTELQRTGCDFEGIHHEIKVISCCDWKAGACIEGNLSTLMK